MYHALYQRQVGGEVHFTTTAQFGRVLPADFESQTDHIHHYARVRPAHGRVAHVQKDGQGTQTTLIGPGAGTAGGKHVQALIRRRHMAAHA